MKKLLLFACLSSLNFMGGGIFAQQENTLPETGNVGIGTLNPSAKLDVNGHVRIDSTLMIKDSILVQKDARIEQDLKIEGQIYSPNLVGAIPQEEKKIVVKDQFGQLKVYNVNDLTQDLYLKTCETDANDNVINPTWNNGINKIYTDCPQIKVGIGTSNPQVKLDVRGKTYTNKLAIGADPNNMIGLFHMRFSANANNTSTIFLIENNQRQLFQISNDGIARSREMILNLTNPWPDFVFEKDYSLMPLQELGTYIERNGHLPNVPSAMDVEKEGIAIGEMQGVLLQKIEELTLYLLEQEKRINELESMLADQNCFQLEK